MQTSPLNRRASFSEFVRDPKVRRGVDDDESTTRTTLWDRLVHINSLLGYAVMLTGMFIVPWLGFYSGYEWMELRDGVMRMNPWASVALFTPAVVYLILVIPFFAQLTENFDVIKFHFAIQFSVGPPLCIAWFTLMYYLIEYLEIDVRRYSIDLISMFAVFIVGITLAVAVYLKSAHKKITKSNDIESKLDHTFLKHQKKLSDIFNPIQLVFMAYIVPQFFASGRPMKLFIVLFLLPVVQELLELFFRSSDLEHAVKWVESGAVSIEKAKTKLSQFEVCDCNLKQTFALLKRFMLLSLGEDAIFALIITAFEEVVRGLLRLALSNNESYLLVFKP